MNIMGRKTINRVYLVEYSDIKLLLQLGNTEVPRNYTKSNYVNVCSYIQTMKMIKM